MTSPRFVFFGTPDIAVVALEHLAQAGFVPSLIVTAPDKPQGRGLVLTPPEAKVWADAHGIPTIQPTSLKTDATIVERLQQENAEFFVVVAYGKIIPKAILDIVPHTFNLHPSILPRHRGPCPIESQILTETNGVDVGVSIMLLDELMDHGPVLAQQDHLAELVDHWPIKAHELRPLLARYGSELLTKVILNRNEYLIQAIEQNHADATVCKKITKEDALLDLSGDAETNYKKILAYDMWPRAYFFVDKDGKQMRVIVTDAMLDNGVLVINKVIPEGRKEMDYKAFLSAVRQVAISF